MKYQVNISKVVVSRGAGSAVSQASVQQPAQAAARRVRAAAPGLATADLDTRIAAAITQAIANANARRSPR